MCSLNYKCKTNFASSNDFFRVINSCLQTYSNQISLKSTSINTYGWFIFVASSSSSFTYLPFSFLFHV